MIKKDKLKDGCIVEVRSGDKLIYKNDWFYTIKHNQACFYELADYNDNLLFKDRDRGYLDIVKIGFVNWVMERKDILTDREKEYLKAVIEPVKDRVNFIQKAEFHILKNQFIYIDLNDGCMDLYHFEPNTQFIGMDLEKEYTLEDLGLE